MRLLAAVAERLKELAPKSPLRPRIEGIRRYVWARNQMRLAASLPAIDALLSVGIPVMLLKGGARLASDPRAASSRFLRDFDLLVPRSEMAPATDALLDAGFRPSTGLLPGSARASAFIRDHSDGADASVRPEIDLHWSALRFGRIADHDDRLLSRARSVDFLGRTILVPSAADQLIIALAHGAVADTDRPCDWVIDAIQTLRDASMDWSVVANEVQARRLEIPVAAGLAFLEDELGLNVPSDIRERFERALRSRLFLAEFLSEVSDRDQRGPIKRLTSSIAEHIRARGLRHTPPPAMPKVSVLPKLTARAKGRWTPLPNGAPAALPAQVGRSLVLSFDLHDYIGRCDFDLLIGGRWTARIKIRRRRWLGFRGSRFLVRVTLPMRWRDRAADTVQLIALDDRHEPQSAEGMSVFMRLPDGA